MARNGKPIAGPGPRRERLPLLTMNPRDVLGTGSVVDVVPIRRAG